MVANNIDRISAVSPDSCAASVFTEAVVKDNSCFSEETSAAAICLVILERLLRHRLHGGLNRGSELLEALVHFFSETVTHDALDEEDPLVVFHALQ